MTRPAHPASTLTIALEKVAFMAPDRVTDDTSVLTLKNLVFEPLCRWQDGLAGPGLFARWTHSPDGRIWRFQVREGARFHDGKPCTAEDVIAFIAQLLGAVDTFGMPWPYARYLAGCEMRAIAADCMELIAPAPFGDVLDIFSEFYLCRVAPDGQPVLGTGPYRVDVLEPGRAVTLRRVGQGTGPARVQVLSQHSAEDRLRGVAEGACDVALNLERVDGVLDMHAGLQWQCRPNTLSVMSYLDCTRGLFSSAAARLAINLAVDSGLIVDELFGGLGIRASTIVSPFHLGFARSGLSPVVPDRDRAARLFASAGATAPIVLRTPTSMPHKAHEITAMVAEMLRAVGVGVRIEIEADRPEYARQLGRKQMGDCAIFDSSPHSSFRILNDKVSSAVRGTWWQGYENPAVEAAIAAANRSLGDVQRADAYARCLVELQRDPPWLYLFHPIDVLAARPGVQGLLLDHQGVLFLQN